MYVMHIMGRNTRRKNKPSNSVKSYETNFEALKKFTMQHFESNQYFENNVCATSGDIFGEKLEIF